MSENMASSGPIPAARPAAGMLGTHTLKVMIAEDDLLLADMLEDALTKGGYEVCGIADTVEKAVELGERYKPDLAVLDIRLAKGGSGTDIPARLNRPASMGVLFASGHADQMSLTKTDGDALITKPYRSEDIIRGLEIVEQIILTGDAPGPYPSGLSVLPGSHRSISTASSSIHDKLDDASDIEFADLIRRLRLQQTELLEFSNYARSEPDLDKLMTEATRICAACLGTTYSAISRFSAADNAFFVEAAFGLHRGFVGTVLKSPSLRTPFGRAFITGKPVVSSDLINDASFSLPPYYTDHGITSLLVVPIPCGIESPTYGVLAVGGTVRRDFDVLDANFLAGFSNVLRRAIDTADRGLALKKATDQVQEMIADRDRYIGEQTRILAAKERLLETSEVLTKELKHRVRNNLQLILSMLSTQLNATTDPNAIDGFGKIEHRVMTLVKIYETLLGSNLGRTLNFGGYLTSLCSGFSALNIDSHPKIKLTCQSVSVDLGLDEASTLGLVISELVTNSYSHAFPDDTGTIQVSLTRHSSGNATITVVDDGVGFADTGESKRHGVGLAKRLMEQIAGSATLRSNHGSEWTLTFPVPTIPASAPASAD